MDNSRKTVALLCLKYEGGLPPISGPFFGLDSAKYRKICIYLKKGSNAPNPVEEKGCRAFYVSSLQAFRLFNFVAIWKLSRILRAERVDILHCHRHQATVYGAIAAKIAKTRVVLSHIHGLNRSKNPRRKFINLLVLRWVKRIIAVSELSRQDVIKCNRHVKPEQVVCLNNSIDCKRFSEVSVSRYEIRDIPGIGRDEFVFGTVGRLVPTKGLPFLLKAFALTRRRVGRGKLIVVGDGRMRDELKDFADELGLADHVHFLGYRKDVEKLLRAMDVFVLASIAEGMPGALLEAMAAGVPCISTAVGGIPDVLESGRFGTLVEPGDENALAKAMIARVTEPSGEGADAIDVSRAEAMKEYDHSVVTKRLEMIYETEYESD